MENRLEQGPDTHERQPKQGLPVITPYLRLISGGHDLVIPACAGGPRASLSYSRKIFTGYIDEDFKNWEIDIEQSATEAMAFLVYEMYDKDGTFMDIYGSFGIEKGALSFQSQEQIERFAIEHRCWLQVNGNGTFFLFSEVLDSKQEFFVAVVDFDDDGHLRVSVLRLSSGDVWPASRQPRFVLPATGLLGA